MFFNKVYSQSLFIDWYHFSLWVYSQESSCSPSERLSCIPTAGQCLKMAPPQLLHKKCLNCGPPITTLYCQYETAQSSRIVKDILYCQDPRPEIWQWKPPTNGVTQHYPRAILLCLRCQANIRATCNGTIGPPLNGSAIHSWTCDWTPDQTCFSKGHLC